MQIRVRKSLSLPLQPEWRDFCPRFGISSWINSHTQMNRDHRCKKSIWNSVKYCFADPHVYYMHFLEECHKAEDEDKVGQAKAGPPKAKVAAATILPLKEDELAKQLKYQQHQIDTLVGQVKNLLSAVRATRVSSRGAMAAGFGRQPQNTWRGGSRGRSLSTQTHH